MFLHIKLKTLVNLNLTIDIVYIIKIISSNAIDECIYLYEELSLNFLVSIVLYCKLSVLLLRYDKKTIKNGI